MLQNTTLIKDKNTNSLHFVSIGSGFQVNS